MGISRKPYRASEGFHRHCGGPVAWKSQKAPKTGKIYKYLMCSDCKTRVPPADLLVTDPGYRKQQTAGVSRKIRRRYTYRNWKDVKE